MFYWKGGSLKEYWDCVMNAFIWTEDDSKSQRPDLIVDDGVDMTLLIHEGKKVKEL